jgi:branched-chain amino acid transport system substrate-binding protein
VSIGQGLVTAATLVLVVQLGCFAPAALAGDTIKVGVIAPLNTPPGEGLVQAAKMATQEINAAGGIGGKRVELIIANDEYKANVGANAYKKLALSDRVVAVIGTASSGVSLAIVDHMARYKVPVISTGAASLQLSRKVEQEYGRYKYWFRVMHTTDDLAHTLNDFIANFLMKERGFDRAAILAEDALWTKGVLPMVRKSMASTGATIVADETFDLDTKDFKPLLTKIAAGAPQFILDLSSHVDGSLYVKQWGELHGAPMVGVNSSGNSSRFWKDTAGNAVSHMDLIHGSYRAALTPKTIAWYDRYVTEWKVSPDYTSGYTYDAMFVLKEAIERAGSSAPERLVAALEATDYVGAAARWKFEKNHNAKFGTGYRVMGVTQWRQDGTRRVIWPPEIKTGDFIMPPWQSN